MQEFLPPDLWEFLSSGEQLQYDPAKAEAGKVRLHATKDLRIGRVYAAPLSELDPNRGNSGVYRIPVISLVASCGTYDPAYLISWLPFEHAYAVFDGDHALVTVFPDATWTDIAAAPLDYLNALWDREPVVPVVREEYPWWQRYAFYEEAFE